MSDLHKAAQQALEALQAVDRADIGLDDYVNPNLTSLQSVVDTTIEALRAALAQEPAGHAWGCKANAFGECSMGCATQQPAVQEPVGSKTPLTDALNFFTESERLEFWKMHDITGPKIAVITQAVLRKLKTTAAPQPAVQEPTAKFDDPRVQTVYEVLCNTDDRPPAGSDLHWEGWVSQRIVDKLFPEPLTRLTDERDELKADAERGRYMIENGSWHRGEEQTHLAVLVPQSSDLSCLATRRAAIDAARRKT